MTCKQAHACWAILFALWSVSLHAGDFALVGGTVHTAAGNAIADGVVIVRSGKVAAVGPRDSTPIPEGVEAVNVEGKHVTPGLIDLYSRLLLAPGELRDQGGAESRSVMDALDPFDPAWSRVLADGVTTVAVAPGLSQGPGGLGAVAKLGPDGARVIARESHFVAALGVSSDRSTSAERLDQYYRLRELFLAAKEYGKSWDAHWKAVEKYNEDAKKRADAEKEAKKPDAPAGQPDANAPKPPEPPRPPRAPAVEVGREVLLRALSGKIPVFIEAHRRDDLEYALLLRKELGLKLVILGATQGRLSAGAIASAEVPVVVEPALLDRWALEYRGHSEANAAQLAASKVSVAISSNGAGGLASRRLRLEAISAVRGGLASDAALRAVTIEPAKILGLASRLGSIEAGKDADLVVFSGDPMDARSRVELVAVDGRLSRGAAAATRALTRAAPEGAPPAAGSGSPGSSRPRSPNGKSIVLRNAHIVTPLGGRVRTIEKGTIVVRDGAIEAVNEATEAPPSADGIEAIDVGGKWVLPGFIDAHSHAGLGGETDDTALAISEDLRVLDAFDPWDPELPRLLSRGITSVALSPGAINVVGGKVSIIKVVPRISSLRVVDGAAAIKASLAPALTLPRYPTSLSGAVRALEEWARGGGARKLGVKGPVIVDVPSRATAERAIAAFGDAGMALVDGGRIPADAWGQLHPSCTVILGPYGLGDPASRIDAAAVLRAAGTPIAFAMGGTRRDLLTSAVLAMQQGLTEDDALRALTEWPARLYGMSGRLGSIEKGADADLVVWSGDPFSLTGRVELAFVDGERMDLNEQGPEREPLPASRPETRAARPPEKAFIGGHDASAE